jgi:hypothetical protein
MDDGLNVNKWWMNDGSNMDGCMDGWMVSQVWMNDG